MLKISIIKFPLQFFFLFFLFFFTFISLYAFLSNIVSVRLNKSARKKRREGQSFKELLFFSRFRDVIPKFWFFFYIVLNSMNFTAILICMLLNLLDVSPKISTQMVLYVFIFDTICMMLHSIIFWVPNGRFNNKAIKKWFGKKKK